MDNKTQRPKLVLIQGGKKDRKSPWVYVVLIFIFLSILMTFMV